MLDTTAATIARHGMLLPGMRVIVAVSGGPDSVCLLHVLRELAPRIGFTVAGVAHVNHKLRGEESDADADLVAALASQFGLPLHLKEARVGEGNLEQSARRARRTFFHGLVREGQADRVALGHTRDDQAETVLFRLLRGAGLAGLAGILPVTAEGLIRPFLGVTREQVRAFLKAGEITWREDASNRDPRFARNRIRRDLLPQLAREWNPQIADALAHLGDLAYEEERWWAIETPRRAGFTVPGPGEVELHAGQLAGQPLSIARRIVRHALRTAKGNLRGIEFGHVERVIALAVSPEGGGKVVLPGVRVTRSFDWIQVAVTDLSQTPGAVRITQGPGLYPAPDGKSLISLELKPGAGQASACDTLKAELCWPDRSAGLELRGWQAGDQYRPSGYACEQKLKDLFQRARVPSWRRACWPILSQAGRIVWSRQFGVAAEFAAGRESGSRVLVREIPSGSGDLR